MSTSSLKAIPYSGLGIGLRNEIAAETFDHADEIDVVEVISEHFFSQPIETYTLLKRALEKFKVIPHGINLSIGGTPEITDEFLSGAKRLTEYLNAPYYSDHFCITKHDDLSQIGHLSPIWYTEESLELIIRRVDRVQQFIGKPLVLENITAPFVIPGADYEEPEFITKVCEKTGCGLLIDLTNIFINAANREEDAQKLLERYPMDYVVHVHLAGGMQDHEGKYIDSHSASVHEQVWPLLEWTAKEADIKTLIIERDENMHAEFNDLVLADLRHARSIVEGARSSK
jgi:uncharacterized protein